ncbi:histidine phosphatase family protein [Alloiococcus sp. CFN-8]|uniref:histidine phosphatase family protein n=1 Tax=Alloiococcus sp. CFN-8 TaxID=3416081 RepID=UPI003CF246B3
MRLYLTRHGETEGNFNGRYCGICDTPLTERGKAQGLELSLKLRGIHFDDIYVSPLKRCRETLSLALENEALGREEERLRERSFGIFENKTYEEILERYPEEERLWSMDWKNYRLPGGESTSEAYERIKSFVKELEEQAKMEDALEEREILIVTHGGIIKLFLCYVLGENLDLFWKLKSDTASVSILNCSQGFWSIEKVNF